jgi:hypothetical protein
LIDPEGRRKGREREKVKKEKEICELTPVNENEKSLRL